MSRAFVKESDGEDPGPLPERRLSPHPNWVTPRGLRLLAEEVARLEAAYAAARAADDRAAVARLSRDLRYWTTRRDTAQAAPEGEPGSVVFGSRVTFRDAEGRRRSYRLVGEDEADPGEGRISWFSPVARALAGRRVGDRSQGPRGEIEILAIEADPEA